MNNIIRELKNLWRVIINETTKPFERLFKGYAKEDLWGLDEYLCYRILKPLKAFREAKKYGYPRGMKSFEEWLKAIDKMILAFELIIEDGMLSERGETKWQVREKKIEEGLELFAKHFRSLWD